MRWKEWSGNVAASAPATTTVTVSVLSAADAVPRTVTEVCSVTRPSTGAVSDSVGSVALARSWSVCSVRLSAASVSRSSSVFAPCVSDWVTSKAPSAVRGTAVPFSVSTTGVASFAVPRTFTERAPMRAFEDGLVTTNCGAVESRTTVTLAVDAFPAASSTLTVRTFVPSFSGTA
ncbi:hypothetical protein COEX109129_10065 [Corallococcus exiguus]